ncbi:Lipopolysaccharide heptosyltransferase 1 [Gammaproteobacteria bacterium]
MKKILLIKTSSLGDLVHTLPVLTDLAYHYPGIRVDWVVEEAFIDIPSLHPAVTRIVPVALRRWRRSPWHSVVWRELVAFWETLRSVEYDLVLDHQGLIKSAVIACLAHGQRWGLDWRGAREPLASFCYDYRCAVARNQHAIIRNRELAARALGYEPPRDLPDYGIGSSIPRLDGLTLPKRYVVCLHATSRASKNWPVAHWIKLGRILANQGFACLLPWGSAAEHLVATTLANEIPQSRVLPSLTLRELACVLHGARLVVGMDTGLTHLAVALGRPTVALYTDSIPSLTGVLPSQGACAINIGNSGQIPNPEQVATIIDTLA